MGGLLIKQVGRYVALILAVLLGIGAMVVEATNGQPSIWGIPGSGGWWALTFSAVGFIIAGRKPEHPVGWLLLLAGVFAGVNGVSGLTTSDPDLSAFLAATVIFSWVPAVGSLATALALTPDGHLPSPRWRPLLIVLWILVVLFGVIQYGGNLLVPPIAIEVALQLVLATTVFVVAVRFRRSHGVERQQLKWIAFAGGLVTAIGLLGEVGFQLLLPELYGGATWVLSLAILCVPVSVGFAMLRYRLYDIDRIISRTVAYVLVTLVLVSAYATVVFLLGRLLPDQSDLAVAASTLAVAALFNPLRRRVQAAVDRQFNRNRYDAARVVDSFAGRIRTERGTQAPADHLLDVARDTMEPLSVSLWLRNRRPG